MQDIYSSFWVQATPHNVLNLPHYILRWGYIVESIASAHIIFLIFLNVLKFTLIGVYHFVWDAGEVFLGFAALGAIGISSSSGIVTTAFLAFSNLAPSSVEPLSPQRTLKKIEKGSYICKYVKMNDPITSSNSSDPFTAWCW